MGFRPKSLPAVAGLEGEHAAVTIAVHPAILLCLSLHSFAQHLDYRCYYTLRRCAFPASAMNS
jgi:hypothetical protein